MNIEHIEKLIFENETFWKESILYLASLEDLKYLKIVILIDEEFSFEYISRKLKLNENDFNSLFFLLKSYWGLKEQDVHLLRTRDFNSLKHIKFDLPKQYYWRY